MQEEGGGGGGGGEGGEGGDLPAGHTASGGQAAQQDLQTGKESQPLKEASYRPR